MQLFTIEQAFQMLAEANDLYSKLAKVLFDVSFKEIFANFGVIFSSLTQGDLKTFIMATITLLGLIIFVYRLARKKLLTFINYLSDGFQLKCISLIGIGKLCRNSIKTAAQRTVPGFTKPAVKAAPAKAAAAKPAAKKVAAKPAAAKKAVAAKKPAVKKAAKQFFFKII